MHLESAGGGGSGSTNWLPVIVAGTALARRHYFVSSRLAGVAFRLAVARIRLCSWISERRCRSMRTRNPTVPNGVIVVQPLVGGLAAIITITLAGKVVMGYTSLVGAR